MNLIPPPPPPETPQIPPAMEGEQYELWGVDEAPSSAELIAASRKLHPVACELCGTLMYATEDQLGTELSCPDCGVRTIAKPRVEVVDRLVGVPDGEEYQLDEASAPRPRPVPTPIAVVDSQRHVEMRESSQGSKDRSHKSRGGKVDDRGRAVRPAVPLAQGVTPMLFTSEVVARGLLLSILLVIVGFFASGLLLDFGAGRGMGAIAGLCFLAIACILGMIWFAMAAANLLAVLTESSEGHDRLYAPPSWALPEWMGEALYLGLSASICGLPAWLAAKAVDAANDAYAWGMDPMAIGLAGIAAWLVCFPIALLSALEEGSPLGVVSPRLLSSLFRCPGPWSLFYLETLLLVGGVAWVAARVASASSIYWTSPLLVGAAFAYMRLLGRLAWWLAEAMPVSAEEEDEA